jgi:hypothetical protein
MSPLREERTMRTYGAHYQKKIATNLKVSPDTARLIYGWMVAELGALDGLGPADFDREALLCLADVEIDPVMAERVAQSVGL